jgi:hypothetical protein
MLREVFLIMSAILAGLALPIGDLSAETVQTLAVPIVNTPAYPLRVSSSHRYLVDSRNEPFLLMGDAPQSLIGRMSTADAAMYMTNRKKYGINTLWISLLCNQSLECSGDATTRDGTAPFVVPGDLSSANPKYFQHVDEIIKIAAENNIVVLLDPIETSGWMTVLRTNGKAKAFAFGQYLGRRYSRFPNIIWLHGNDFQSWKNKTDDELVQAVARGIRSTDMTHIHTVELNYTTSGTLDDPTWAPLVDLDAAYTYFPSYAQVFKEYNRPDPKPVFLIETDYEFEHLAHTDGGSPWNLRRQGYWALLSGAIGQVYGNGYIWAARNGWQTKLDTPGIRDISYMKSLFEGLKWYDLVPDQDHSVVTAGYHGAAGVIGGLARRIGSVPHGPAIMDAIKNLGNLGSITANTYASAARTADGSLVVVYMPTVRPVTVDLSKLSGPMMARWYDPTSGQFLSAGENDLSNKGLRSFKPPDRNSSGDGDWVLVLEAASSH